MQSAHDVTLMLEDKDLSRCVVWDWHDSATIYVLSGEKKIILTAWQTAVFFYSEGFRTVHEIAHALMNGRKENHEYEIAKAAQELLNMEVVLYTDNSYSLPYKHYTPISEYNLEDEKQYNRDYFG